MQFPTLATAVALGNLMAATLMSQGLPAPSPPPAFMRMKGLPLACFSKPSFQENGLEFFVCNGGLGLGGVRKKSDASQTIWVAEQDIALNMNMQVAKSECGKKQFVVRSDRAGMFSFSCDGEELRGANRFQPASRADWKRYQGHLAK